jgi:hypothetical protein
VSLQEFHNKIQYNQHFFLYRFQPAGLMLTAAVGVTETAGWYFYIVKIYLFLISAFFSKKILRYSKHVQVCQKSVIVIIVLFLIIILTHRILDHIHLMTYDFHGTWDQKLGLNAPVYAGPADHSALEQQLNIDTCVNYWLRNGAPKEKLILGMPLYGRTFVMANTNNHQPGAAINGAGQAGPYTRQAGMLGYNEVIFD